MENSQVKSFIQYLYLQLHFNNLIIKTLRKRFFNLNYSYYNIVDDFDDPRNVLSYARQAKSLKDYSAAIRYLKHVIKDYETPLSPYVDPIQEKKINYIETLIELGNIYSILTLHADAIKSYTKALGEIESNLNDIDPETKEPYYLTIYKELSKNYEQVRNHPKSSEFFQRYLQHRNNRI